MKRALAVVALLLGVGAAVAGARPAPPPPIGAQELAQAIRDRRAGLTVIDLRGAEAFAADALPAAVEASPAEQPTPGARVVLYGPEPRLRAEGEALRRRGFRDVRRLEGGVDAWREQVLSPVLPPDAASWTTQERRVADLSAYFGGAPRTSADVPARESGRRRGC